MAPVRVGFWLTRTLRRAGRRDAKKYQSIQDTTATHFVRKLEAETHTNQRKVNAWLVQELAPFRAGNAALDDLIKQLDLGISRLESDLGPSGRIRKANTVRLNTFRQQRLNALSQKSSNLASGLARIEVAGEALDSWHRFFEAKVAIYVRARSLKNKQIPPASVAALPSIESIDLIETPDFQVEEFTREGSSNG